MSLLRPGVIKLHKTQTQTIVLALTSMAQDCHVETQANDVEVS